MNRSWIAGESWQVSFHFWRCNGRERVRIRDARIWIQDRVAHKISCRYNQNPNNMDRTPKANATDKDKPDGYHSSAPVAGTGSSGTETEACPGAYNGRDRGKALDHRRS
jgi:hypothetical protein